ncbi:MAG: hypothetical protein ABI415_11840 [Flavitalea sp.]
MKFLFASIAILSLFSCQKEVSNNSVVIESGTVFSDALMPLACHTTSFVTNYSTVAGQVPPFRFTKTLYPDTRVKTINMLSRAFPNYSAFKKYAYELIGTFTYSINKARFTGTRETWEYYVTTLGGAGKRSLGKMAVDYYFNFNPNNGYCLRVGVGGYTWSQSVVEYFYNDAGTELQAAFLNIAKDIDISYFYFKHDSRGNMTGNYHVYEPYQTLVSYQYDYTKSGGQYTYQPSQYAISYEYSLCEVMQWLPPAKNPRTGVSVQFYPNGNATFVKQGQVYKNNIYDPTKKLISYTYGDNVSQKITWFCK